jgi:alkanesulfonate monooxygenase SsuD/methylene tetrahydromethanopterin reductase-like flavin-dependent oxidoreductase (luciferase family)
MEYAVALPTGGECGDPRFLVELAEIAEHAGWDAVVLEDYVLYQGDAAMPTCNTWIALAAIAMRTERLRLILEVTPLARRRPWNVAREAAGVDQLSGGRMVLGVGLGDVGEIGIDASFTHFGEATEARVRAELLDEGLEIVAGLWRGEPFSFHGKHFHVDEVTFLPRPVQTPRIPIWVGGGYPGRRPVERALRWDGSCLYKRGGGDMTADDVADLRARGGDAFTIAVGARPRKEDWDEDRDHIRSVRDAGADWWLEFVPPAEREAMRAAIGRGPLRVS